MQQIAALRLVVRLTHSPVAERSSPSRAPTLRSRSTGRVSSRSSSRFGHRLASDIVSLRAMDPSRFVAAHRDVGTTTLRGVTDGLRRLAAGGGRVRDRLPPRDLLVQLRGAARQAVYRLDRLGPSHPARVRRRGRHRAARLCTRHRHAAAVGRPARGSVGRCRARRGAPPRRLPSRASRPARAFLPREPLAPSGGPLGSSGLGAQ